MGNQLKLERTKRKKTEELAQSLLTQNEEYKKQISEFSTNQSKIKSENKVYKDQLRKLKQIVDDDRQTIKHLNQQRNAMKSERDESFTLLTKIEKEHTIMVKKEKKISTSLKCKSYRLDFFKVWELSQERM